MFWEFCRRNQRRLLWVGRVLVVLGFIIMYPMEGPSFGWGLVIMSVSFVLTWGIPIALETKGKSG